MIKGKMEITPFYQKEQQNQGLRIAVM